MSYCYTYGNGRKVSCIKHARGELLANCGNCNVYKKLVGREIEKGITHTVWAGDLLARVVRQRTLEAAL